MAIKEVNCVYLTSFLSRLRGMLFRVRSNKIYILKPCNSIHTFGMRYEIDIAFVDDRGVVLEARRDVKPKSFIKNSKALLVCERASTNVEWFNKGDRFECERKF